jgi:glucose/mannose transport system substrate-binding protein
MLKRKQSGLAIAFTLMTLSPYYSNAAELEVTHWWTSGGEAAAVKVFADAFNAGGDTWVDGAIAGSGSTARPVIISRILGGEPMGATQLNHGRQAEELVAEGLMLDLTELAEEEGWRDIVRPEKLLDSCTLDGRIYCVPVNIHSFQWMWTSLDAYKTAGIDAPADWHGFVESAPKLREANIIPLAIGNQAWQINGMFGVLQVGLGGVDLWRKTMIDRDSEALRGEQMSEVWQAFGEARFLQEENNAVQNWNDATNQVITGQAGAQIMGDWAQGEFSVAGYTAGEQYDCLPGLGIAPALDTGGDAFYFPKIDDPEQTEAQLRMASMMLSKAVQVDFNLAKGSLPVRADVDLAAANECMKKGLAILEDPNNILPSSDQSFSPDTVGQLEDLNTEFWSDPDMDPKDAHEAWAAIIEDAD